LIENRVFAAWRNVPKPASKAANFKRCATAHWCDEKSPQVFPGSLGKVERREEKSRGYKKLSKTMIDIVFKNNTLIRILALELLKIMSLLAF
jgi:hypothetical protein